LKKLKQSKGKRLQAARIAPRKAESFLYIEIDESIQPLEVMKVSSRSILLLLLSTLVLSKLS
jgi:hypothetical protein